MSWMSKSCKSYFGWSHFHLELPQTTLSLSRRQCNVLMINWLKLNQYPIKKFISLNNYIVDELWNLFIKWGWEKDPLIIHLSVLQYLQRKLKSFYFHDRIIFVPFTLCSFSVQRKYTSNWNKIYGVT